MKSICLIINRCNEARYVDVDGDGTLRLFYSTSISYRSRYLRNRATPTVSVLRSIGAVIGVNTDAPAV